MIVGISFSLRVSVSVSRYRLASRFHISLTSLRDWPCSDSTQSKASPSTHRNRAITIGGSTMTEEPIRAFDQALLSAWQNELKATCDATLKQQCLQQEPELLPLFVVHYGKLKALRRRVRRSLQRQWKRS